MPAPTPVTRTPATTSPTGRTVVLHDVLDPLSGEREDVRLEVPGPAGPTTDVDGAGLHVLPGLYDADSHLPVLDLGLRESDRWRALAGGATAVTTALPWHLVRTRSLEAVTSFLAATTFPLVLPILSVSDSPSGAGFAAWLRDHGAQIRETWMPTIKLYSNDPFFRPNLEAVWEAGCRAAVYFYDRASFEQVAAEHAGPVHFRHVTSREMAEQVAARPDSTCQTSPHFLVEITPGRAGDLHVLPPVPGGADRDGLREVVTDRVDLIASDHNAPVHGNDGPGLDSEQFLLPALLQLVADGVLDLPAALAKATTAAAAVFRPAAGLPDSRIVVDPAGTGPAGLWPGQESRRAAFLGVPLAGTVLAAETAGTARFL
ncbi:MULTISPECIES: hypothetical protein [Pseudonocardia]|uniref:Dihydroorotase n=1 Tax=Pseudonocardia saturnea TaxID=33909 RepID=A0ABQ0S0D8_9PSEU|nr:MULTISPECIES: hypothetical protein [Pseudonocardia]BBG05439.1 hypothetical protein Pdca_66480 [Pseudonocardia autotrophica]GEC26389.1 hypothetical protein PSA01_34180 [Pseudonocardia saturnea]